MIFDGLIIGAVTFISIAFTRYLTIKAEYWFTKWFWIGFLIIGLGLTAGSLFIDNVLLSISCGILAFNFLWGIGEIIEQEERVAKGWFPKNPRRK